MNKFAVIHLLQCLCHVNTGIAAAHGDAIPTTHASSCCAYNVAVCVPAYTMEIVTQSKQEG